MTSVMPFSQDLYLNALTFAARAHGEQKTPFGLPYMVHVSSVAMEVMAALRNTAIGLLRLKGGRRRGP